MSFPASGVLDDFNRADENPLSGGGNWAAYATTFYSSHALQVVSNRVTDSSNSAAGASKWHLSYGPDCEHYVTLGLLPADGQYVRLWLRAGLAAADENKPYGHFIQYTYHSGSTDTVAIGRQDNGTSLAIHATINQDFAAGDKLGFSIIGTVITVYRYTSGSWGSIGSYNTASDPIRFTAAGLPAITVSDQVAGLDDFGAGTLATSIPVNATAPVASGIRRVGRVLTTTDGLWSGSLATYTYQWQRDTAGNLSYSNIASATSSTYTLVTADLGCNVRCRVTATNGAGAATASSNAIGLVVGVSASTKLMRVAPMLTPAAPVWRQLVRPACVFLGVQLTQNTVYYNGNTYVGYLDAPNALGANRVRVAQINKATGAVTISPAVMSFTGTDIHQTPAVLVRQSDHKLLVVAAAQLGGFSTAVYTALSSSAEDVSAWGSATDITSSLSGAPYTYVNLQQLSGESGKIYLFYSAGFPPDEHFLWYVTSTDGGATWGTPHKLWAVTGKTCYWAVDSGDTSRIDFACSTGHSLNGQTASMYHFYYDGTWRKSDGTSMGTVPAAGFTTTDATKIYDGPTNGNVRAPYAVTKTGPTAVWASENIAGASSPYVYWYGLWTGSAWSVHQITTSAGSGTTGLTGYVEGGIALDPTNHNRVYVSSGLQILSYLTADGGTTWTLETTITTDSNLVDNPNARPMGIKNGDASLRVVFCFGPDPYTPVPAQAIGSQIRGYP